MHQISDAELHNSSPMRIQKNPGPWPMLRRKGVP